MKCKVMQFFSIMVCSITTTKKKKELKFQFEVIFHHIEVTLDNDYQFASKIGSFASMKAFLRPEAKE